MELRDAPARSAGLVLDFTGMDHILHGSKFQYHGKSDQYQPLGNYILRWFSKEENNSGIAFVVHEAKDGIVAAECLAEEFEQKYHVVKWGVDQRNRTIAANELGQFIKK